ncbi:MAG: glycosyltransferase, partial [bacterium]|nr:glycosyltransferase [bacterium]
DNQFGDEGFVSNRLFESLAAGGALMLHQEVPGMEELIGFKDGEHYVKWTDFDDLKEKIAYYLNHEDERQKIADAGTRECRENHSFDKRVEELFEILKTKPLKSYEISVHMICKDEMQYVERVLKTCERFAAEIVIVDTGSTDGTLELLREREGGKLKVYEFEWCDDFAKARNFALSKCTKNWAMWLDF